MNDLHGHRREAAQLCEDGWYDFFHEGETQQHLSSTDPVDRLTVSLAAMSCPLKLNQQNGQHDDWPVKLAGCKMNVWIVEETFVLIVTVHRSFDFFWRVRVSADGAGLVKGSANSEDDYSLVNRKRGAALQLRRTFPQSFMKIFVCIYIHEEIKPTVANLNGI